MTRRADVPPPGETGQVHRAPPRYLRLPSQIVHPARWSTRGRSPDIDGDRQGRTGRSALAPVGHNGAAGTCIAEPRPMDGFHDVDFAGENRVALDRGPVGVGAGETPFETRTEFVSPWRRAESPPGGGRAGPPSYTRPRALSYRRREILEHPFTDAQRRIYDACRRIRGHPPQHRTLKAASCGGFLAHKNAKSAAMSASTVRSSASSATCRPRQGHLGSAIEADLDSGRSGTSSSFRPAADGAAHRRIPASEWDDIDTT